MRKIETKEEGERIAADQKALIIGALKDGMAMLAKVESDEEVEGEFGAQVKRVKQLIEEARGTELGADSADELLAHYETLDNGNLTREQKLFLEFLLGLGFADLNCRIGVEVAKAMAANESFPEGGKEAMQQLEIGTRAEGVIGGLESPAEAAQAVGEKMTELFGSDPEKFWLLVADTLERRAELKALAQKVVSMRRIPKDKTMLGLAQALHWSGFGGNAQFLKEVDGLNLDWLTGHSIGYHVGADGSHFAGKVKALFGALIAKLKEAEADALVPAMKENLAKKRDVKIFDAGAGPAANGSNNWIGKKLRDASFNVTIDTGEVDGSSLAALIQKNLGDVYELDLAAESGEVPKDKYDLFVLSIVLHQLMDENLGGEMVARVLKNATQATKVGGFIAWSDVSEYGFIQSILLPFNVVDGEGCVPENIFKRVKFSDVAVVRSEGMFKIPYRLRKLRKVQPEGVAKKYGSGIYESNAFEIIEVPEAVLNKLDGARANPAECDRIVEEYLDNLGVLSKLQANFRGRIAEVVAA